MKKKKHTIIIIIIIFILSIFLIQHLKKQNNKFQDDIIFFKSFNFGKNQTNQENSNQNQNYNNEIAKVVFDVSYHNIKLKAINLANTIDKNTLVNEKIEPGTSGRFEIVLKTNQKIKYQVKFKSQNEKPENLVFKIEGKDRKYKTLEEIEQELKGEIEKDKTIFINWEWEYEVNSVKNKQDTKDGEKLKQYIFTIYAIGYK